MPVSELHALVKNELHAANALIQAQLRSDVSLTEELGSHIIQSGGKRLRPLLVLLGAGLCGSLNQSAITLAAMVELIHTATLLHDDVVDASTLRRGKKTTNAIWGNQASILVGDFLYSRAFQMMVSLKDFKIFQILSDATAVIAEGEILQLQNCHNPDITEENSMHVVECKTGTLFSAAAQMGTILADRTSREVQAMANYGLRLGTAFQLIDDTLDYCADPKQTGKNLGDDLAEGKTTLPLIYAMKKGTKKEKELIRLAILHGKEDQLDLIIEAIHTTGAVEYTRQAAMKEAELALQSLNTFPDSVYKKGLEQLVTFAVTRQF